MPEPLQIPTPLDPVGDESLNIFMGSLLHPLDNTLVEHSEIPPVRYFGRCPETGRERSLRPTPAVFAEAEKLKRYLRSRHQATDGFSTSSLYRPLTGKMFGVMVCRSTTGQLGTLRAFSGGWAGKSQPLGWVPSSSHSAEYAAQREETEPRLVELTRRIDALQREPPSTVQEQAIEECRAERRRLSRALTARIHQAYRFENFLGEVLPLTQVPSTGTRPPTGMGDCCAPKLLQCAVRHRLEPLGMIEFWWGSPPPALPRVEGAYYGSCEHKCYPILGFLLRGCAAAEVHP